MTEVKKRISALLLALLLLLCMLPQAAAAGNSAARLTIDAAWQSSDMVVTVAITGGEGVSNGRLNVSYDPDLMRLTDAKAVLDCGATSINRATAGKVSLAWVGSKLPAAKTSVLVLKFAPADGAERFDWTAESNGIYAGGKKLDLAKATASLTKSEELPKNPFTDISGHWGEEEILKAYHAGLFVGVTKTEFAPDAQMTRAMLVVVLHRIAGEPAPKNVKTAFTDVAQSSYYAKAVAWAAEAGVVNGISATEFAPERNISRQELVTMLYRYAKYEGRDVSARADISKFNDVRGVQSYALEAVQWAVAEGILKGMPNNLLMPNGLATRAEAAALMVRYTS